MKKVLFLFLPFLFSSASFLYGQEYFQGINIQTLNGIELPMNNALKNGADKPIVLFTWSKEWCWPCVKALDRFSYFYEDLRDNYGLKFIALNLDKETTSDEIKEFMVDYEWLFDIYQDPDGNYMAKLNKTSAPETFLIVNNVIIEYKSGFLKGVDNPEPNADYIANMVKSIGKKTIYYDDAWDYTSQNNASYVRYIDYLDDIYEVRDRWITGELQMRGQFLDKWLTTREGKFIWYFQNGVKSSVRNYVRNVENGISSQWYENEQLWVIEEYIDGRLNNILELYGPDGKPLAKGNFSNGTGYLYRYDVNGVKTSKREYVDGLMDGKSIVYNKDGSVNGSYIYSKGNFVKKEE